MNNRGRKWILAVSHRLYGLLLMLYPIGFKRRFGPEMAQAFDDLSHHYVHQRGLIGLIALWRLTVWDVTASVIIEHQTIWKEYMRIKQLVPMAMGSILLAYSTLFAAINILKYNLGFSAMWNPYDAIVSSARPSLIGGFLELLIIVGPGLALVLYLLPLIRVKLEWRGERLATIVIHRGGPITMLLLGICFLVGSIFVIYVTLENLSCGFGQQLIC